MKNYCGRINAQLVFKRGKTFLINQAWPVNFQVHCAKTGREGVKDDNELYQVQTLT
ncbi:hypothetical protein pah_c050o162 [Parachlamydia acanthamoebae str. Hall's coccus]|uniref:Uncharacterized protein n=1 Tax=Parachlamydia acanthamoebae TaxID=83552 RepID=A0A0C1C413_9BACT|nr:hypothetical protein pah_c050o162 [Parachlamydia acanthamoebae str. Hall's coccus]KIA78261.1 hypothetical protein DB43_EI00060 [Parachlamydia acanthamoebae]